jgi:hypothetical protein
MTPLENLHEQLTRWQPGNGPNSFSADLGDWTVRVEADRADSIGCLVRELNVTRSAVGVEPIAVGDWAKAVASKAVGLLEPLRLLEVDGDRNEAILRSDTPARNGDRVAYYEAVLKGDGIGTLRRYTTDVKAGSKRDDVPFALTHEAIAKVAMASIPGA